MSYSGAREIYIKFQKANSFIAYTIPQITNMKTRKPMLKALLSLSNDGIDYYARFEMPSSTASRQTFVNSCIQFLRRNNFDGLDIYPHMEDWTEPPCRTYFNELFSTPELAFNLESATGPSRLLLTFDIKGRPDIELMGQNIKEGAQKTGWFNLLVHVT